MSTDYDCWKTDELPVSWEEIVNIFNENAEKVTSVLIEVIKAMANLAVKEAVEGRLHIRVRTPLLRLTKAAIVRLGTKLGVDYGLTHSCYDPTPEGLACGRCDSCLLRRKGFAEAGVPDPTRYADPSF